MNRPEGICPEAWSKAVDLVMDAKAERVPYYSTSEEIREARLADATAIAKAIQSSVEAERSRAAGEVETLIESLNEGLMTDGDLSKADVIAMRHQLEALHLAVDAIRKGA